MLRPERDDLGEAERRLARPLLAVQQDAEVVVRVRVVGIDADRGSIRRLRLDDPSLRPEHHAEVVVRVGVLRIECDRALVRARSPRPARADPAGRSRGCCASPPARARARDFARSARRPRSLSRLLMGEHAREVQRVRHGRARLRGCCGRSPQRPPTARSAAATIATDSASSRLSARSSAGSSVVRTTPPCSP